MSLTAIQDGSTMLMEAAKGGHFETMSLLLDWPASSAAATDAASQGNKVFTVTCFTLLFLELQVESIV